VRGEDSQLPNGGGLNITNKIGEKIKNKTDLHKSNSKATLTNSEQYSKVSSVRFVDSIIDSEKGDSGRMEAVLEQLSTEIVKLGEKWAVQEERLDRLEKSCKKNEENSANVFSSPQMEEINKILSLVEKSEQRDDYRKTIKMIEELRVNILDLHSEVKNLESPPLTPPEHNFN
jgi:glycerol-3-phosphate cytidylyltransferase-like family protein